MKTAETKMQLVDWLDDLCVRFIINLPREELESVERICFQIEEAQWFYEDFVRPLDPQLPSLNLRQFCLKIFQHCPLFSGYDSAVHSNAFSEFLAYKTRVPVRGAILLNEAMTEVVLVKGWKKAANWSFPRGKINKDERDIDCAIREVYEETGYDVRAAGLVDEAQAKYIEVTMREQHMKLFVFAGVPMNTHFEPRTRKEISKIQWYKLTELPTSKRVKQQQQETQDGVAASANKFYMVAPFLGPLKKIIGQLRKVKASSSALDAERALPIRNGADAYGSTQRIEESVTGQPAGMEALMSKLRESKNSVEQRRPADTYSSIMSEEKASLAPSDRDKPLKHALQPAAGRNSTSSRETKAQAILSLLRSGSEKVTETTSLLEAVSQVPGNTSTLPVESPSYRHFAPYVPTPISKPISASVDAGGASNPRDVSPYHLKSVANAGITGVVPSRQPPAQPTQSLPATAPYHHTRDFSLSQPASSNNAMSTNAPAPGKLPLPRLSAHSSALLSLFKSPPTTFRTTDTLGSQPAAQISVSHLESQANGSVQAPDAQLQNEKGQSSPPVIDPGQGLVPVADKNGRRQSAKRSSHQETLLGLFKAPTTPSHTPSLSPAAAPAELSAIPVVGNPTPDKASRLARPLAPASGPSVPGQIRLAKRPAGADAVGPSARHQPGRAPMASREAPKSEAPKPVKILSRPSSSHNHSNESRSINVSSSQQSQRVLSEQKSSKKTRHEKSESSSKPFQPTILKRPISTDQAPEGSSDWEATISQLDRGRDSMLDLARGQPHAPVPTKSPAPRLYSRSRDLDKSEPRTDLSLASRKDQLNLGASSSSRKPRVPDSVATPIDQSFLLGFLGEVAKGSR